MSYYDPLTYTVPPQEDGWVLKTILQRRMKISRKLLSRLKLTEQGITVNDVRQYINVHVQAGDRVEIRMEQEESDHILPQNLPFAILYEDAHLLLVNKEAGMIVHPTHGHYMNTLANAVVYHWMSQGESYRFRPVHRLDQDTSGVLCIAKNPFIHQNIAEQMKANQVRKEYLALVHGVLPHDEGTIDAPIARNPLNPHIRMVADDGYDSVTHYRVEQSFGSASLVRLWLETGRTHQIRVHMRHLGHPLIGDPLYGREDEGSRASDSASDTASSIASGKESDSLDVLISRQALHATLLGLIHPATKEPMEFAAGLPLDMTRVLDHLLSEGGLET